MSLKKIEHYLMDLDEYKYLLLECLDNNRPLMPPLELPDLQEYNPDEIHNLVKNRRLARDIYEQLQKRRK